MVSEVLPNIFLRYSKKSFRRFFGEKIQPSKLQRISKALHHRWANNTRATRRRDESGAHGTALTMDLGHHPVFSRQITVENDGNQREPNRFPSNELQASKLGLGGFFPLKYAPAFFWAKKKRKKNPLLYIHGLKSQEFMG